MSDFEQATKLKLRFTMNSVGGNMTVEDLWDLPLMSTTGAANLDSLAIELDEQVNKSKRKSFVVKKTGKDKILTLMLNIVKHIIGVKLEEIEASEQAATNKAEREEIMGILAQRKNDERKELSTDELEKKLKELQ